jgi:hypothetical protein
MSPRPRLPANCPIALAASVTTLRHLFLAAECCGHTAIMPLRIAQASGIGGTLADMVLRLACQRCGGAPAVVALLDHLDGLTAPYGNAPWRLCW